MNDTNDEEQQRKEKSGKTKVKCPSGPPFSLKKWNAVAMWQWDVECDTCAICRVQVMGELHSFRALAELPLIPRLF